MGRFVACVVLGLFGVTACGGSSHARATGTAGADAAYATGGSGGTAGAIDAGDASWDAPFGGTGGTGGACPVPPGEELGPAQVVAQGQHDLWGIGTSKPGPVWVSGGYVVLAGGASRMSQGLPIESVGSFVARGGWFAAAYEAVRGLGTGVTVGLIPGPGAIGQCYYEGADEVDIDSSYVYGLVHSDGSGEVTRAPLLSSCSSSKQVSAPVVYQVPFWSPAMAVGESLVYVFALTGPGQAVSPDYSIFGFPKEGGARVLVTHGVDPEVSRTSPYTTHVAVRAYGGTLAWSRVMGAIGETHYVWVLPPGATTPRAVVEPTGTYGTIALDDHYVYWVTLTGEIKRECITGGSPEVIAKGEARGSDIAVDDNGVYWLDPAAGKVMEMKKLGAPGSDAGADASMDASPSEASVDASAEAIDAATDSSSGASDAIE